ncbi:uncharacterized protein METZ01_LOCUS30814, partial [marine metagenome]
VDLPKQIVSTFLGILKYSIVLANAKELGGMTHSSFTKLTKLVSSKCFGSTVAEFILVKILNSFEHLTSYP